MLSRNPATPNSIVISVRSSTMSSRRRFPPQRSTRHRGTGDPCRLLVVLRAQRGNANYFGDLLWHPLLHFPVRSSATSFVRLKHRALEVQLSPHLDMKQRSATSSSASVATDGRCRDCVHGGWLVADVDSWRFPHCSRAFQCRPGKGGEPRSFTIGVPRRIHQWRRRLLNNDLLPKWTQYFGSVCCPQCALPFGSWCFHALMVFAVKTGVHAECCRHPLVREPRVRVRVLA